MLVLNKTWHFCSVERKSSSLGSDGMISSPIEQCPVYVFLGCPSPSLLRRPHRAQEAHDVGKCWMWYLHDDDCDLAELQRVFRGEGNGLGCYRLLFHGRCFVLREFPNFQRSECTVADNDLSSP